MEKRFFNVPYLKLFSIPYSIPYFQSKDSFRPEAKRNLFCTLVALSVALRVVALEGWRPLVKMRVAKVL